MDDLSLKIQRSASSNTGSQPTVPPCLQSSLQVPNTPCIVAFQIVCSDVYSRGHARPVTPPWTFFFAPPFCVLHFDALPLGAVRGPTFWFTRDWAKFVAKGLTFFHKDVSTSKTSSPPLSKWFKMSNTIIFTITMKQWSDTCQASDILSEIFFSFLFFFLHQFTFRIRKSVHFKVDCMKVKYFD